MLLQLLFLSLLSYSYGDLGAPDYIDPNEQPEGRGGAPEGRGGAPDYYNNVEELSEETDNNDYSEPPEGPDEQFNATEYLIKFGYLDENGGNFTEAITDFQEMAGIPQTGVVDLVTQVVMKRARCGNADPKRTEKIVPTLHSSRRGLARDRAEDTGYIIAPGDGWKKTALLYEVDINSVPINIRGNARRIVANITSQWAAASGFQISEVSRNQQPDIIIKWAKGFHGDHKPFDGKGGTLAHAFFPSAVTWKGHVHFDAEDRWRPGPNQGGHSFLHIALHEFGHVLGLDHSRDRESVMYPYFAAFANWKEAKLTEQDIAGIREVFQRVGGTVPSGRLIFPKLPPTSSSTTSTQSPRDSGRCSYFHNNPLRSIVHMFGNTYFTVDNRLFKVNSMNYYIPEPINQIFRNVNNQRVSSFLTLRSESQSMIYLYLFQNNLVWKYAVYENSHAAPGNLLYQTYALNQLRIYAFPGYPQETKIEFYGVDVQNPVVFQFAGDDYVYFLTPSSYWVWMPRQSSPSVPLNYSDHPVLGNLPIRPPDLSAAIVSGDRNYFLGQNGSYWTWISYVSNGPEFAYDGQWSQPQPTVRWILQCRD